MALRKKNAIKKQASKPKAPLKKAAPQAKLQALKKSGPVTGKGMKPKPSINKAAGVLKTKKGEAPKAKKASLKPSVPKGKKQPAAKAKPAKAKPAKAKPAKPQAKKPQAAKAKLAKAKPPKSKSTAPARKAKTSKAKKGLKAKPVPVAASAKAKAVLKAKLLKERAADQALREKAREKAQKEKDREKAQLQKLRDAEKNRKEAERVKLQQQKEKEQVRREKQREQARLQKSRALEKLQKEKERQASKLAAEREREEQRKAKEAERLQAKAEQAAEKLRLQEEKDLAREQARQAKEDERKAKEDEREAYRKAKEIERDRLRAERQAAKRLLEVKVARAQRRANRGAARGGGTRVYRPDAVPNQMGTTRRQDTLAALQSMQSKFANLRSPQQLLAEKAEKTAAGHIFEADIPKPPPAPPVLPPASIEERYALIQARLESQPNTFKHDYAESFDMSWIYHDSALEGVVYTFQELKTAIDPNIAVVPDSSLQPVCEEIRRHKAAIELVRDLAEKKRVPITMDTVKKIYVTLHPEEGDIKNVKYRKDIPQHRLYFHEYAQPEKIALKVRQAIDWLGTPEAKKIKSPVRIAARVHYDLLRIFPFPHDSGKVARLLMNLLLLRAGYPPAIIHSTERQKYYEALKGSLPIIVSMVTDAISNGLASVEKLLDERVTPTTAASPMIAVNGATPAASTPAGSTPVTPKNDAGDSSEPPRPDEDADTDEAATDAGLADDDTSFDDDEEDDDEEDDDDTSFDSD